jgi:outer membrane protein TolC
MLVGADGAVDAADDVRFEDPRNSAETLDDVVAKRSDVAVLERARRAAATVVKDSWLDYLPYLNGAFTPFFQNPSTATQPELGWQAQLLLGVPLFDGGTRYGVHAERRALETDAALRLEQALTQARSELRVAAQAVARADRTLEAAREAEAHAREALALANEAYRAGATRSLEVVDAERRARDAETQVAIAEDAARQARLELLVASGRFP